jgi:EAL domain-containing protein (putative c-di-GMP-specific phosphodiesterase class I)
MTGAPPLAPAQPAGASPAPRSPDVLEGLDLLAGLARGELGGAFRPIVHLATGALVGWQAFARWDHPRRGSLRREEFLADVPDRDLEHAEREVDLVVVEHALATLAHADASHAASRPTMSVQLSRRTLTNADLAVRIAEMLQRHGLAAHRLFVEVAGVVDPDEVDLLTVRLEALHDQGVKITLCDVACTDTSFARLRTLPFDRLHLGACCTAAIEQPREQAIVRAVLALARDLAVDVVADGVDTDAQDRVLRRLGCSLAHGARFGEAGPFLQAPVAHEPPQRSARRRFPVPANEVQRLGLLYDTGMLDSAREAVFDDIAAEAARVCGTPIALVTLVDVDRVFFKATYGVGDARSISRSTSICAHAICDPGITVVADALADPRFCENPLVVDLPSLRSYAGAPLVTSDGVTLGTVCVLDHVARELSQQQLAGLVRLAAHASSQVELRARLHQLERCRQSHEAAERTVDELRRLVQPRSDAS